jgi:quercetin dioxygenase-like cupin family protein
MMARRGKSLSIVRRSEVPRVKKPEGTAVWYYKLEECEIHYNEIDPRTIQQWHNHRLIDESILVLEGMLTVRWKDRASVVCAQELYEGDLVRVGQSHHSFENETDNIVRTVVFRFVPTGRFNQDILTSDKNLHE